MKVEKNDEIFCLIDLKKKESMHLYYALKERFDYKIENRSEVINGIKKNIEDFVSEYDFIVYPESSSSFLTELVNQFEHKKVLIEKNSISKVIEFSNNLNLQKKERESHIERIKKMGEKFKINQMKSTQRLKYESVIFKETIIPKGRGLIIDDSYFSGTTYRGIIAITGKMDFLAIFSK